MESPTEAYFYLLLLFGIMSLLQIHCAHARASEPPSSCKLSVFEVEVIRHLRHSEDALDRSRQRGSQEGQPRQRGGGELHFLFWRLVLTSVEFFSFMVDVRYYLVDILFRSNKYSSLHGKSLLLSNTVASPVRGVRYCTMPMVSIMKIEESLLLFF